MERPPRVPPEQGYKAHVVRVEASASRGRESHSHARFALVLEEPGDRELEALFDGARLGVLEVNDKRVAEVLPELRDGELWLKLTQVATWEGFDALGVAAGRPVTVWMRSRA